MRPRRSREVVWQERRLEVERRAEENLLRLEVAHLLNPRWNGMLAVILGAAIILHQVVIFFAGAILLLALALSWLWGRYCLDGVSYGRHFSAPAVAFGDEVTLTIEVVNRKLLPLPWLDITDEAPAALPLVGGELPHSWKARRRILPNLLALRWYERVARHYRLRCLERGEHVFGPVELRSGDLFGLASRTLELPWQQRLLVYPKVVPIAALRLPPRFPLGETRGADRLHSDPLRVAGIRAYTHGDSLRQVHWKASARLGDLQVKTYDPSATLRCMILLNVDTMPRAWEGVRADLLELVICAAASLAAHLTQERYQVGLAANGLVARRVARVRVPPSRAPGHLTTMLTMLARLTPLATIPFADLLRLERAHVPAGATVILITGLWDDALSRQAYSYRAAGHPVSLLLVGEQLRGISAPGLDTHWIGDEAHWRELQELDIASAELVRAAR